MTCELCGVPLDPHALDHERTLCPSCLQVTRELDTDPCAAPNPEDWEKVEGEP